MMMMALLPLLLLICEKLSHCSKMFPRLITTFFNLNSHLVIISSDEIEDLVHHNMEREFCPTLYSAAATAATLSSVLSAVCACLFVCRRFLFFSLYVSLGVCLCALCQRASAPARRRASPFRLCLLVCPFRRTRITLTFTSCDLNWTASVSFYLSLLPRAQGPRLSAISSQCISVFLKLKSFLQMTLEQRRDKINEIYSINFSISPEVGKIPNSIPIFFNHSIPY